MKSASEHEIQSADPAARKKALLLVAVVAGVGAVVVWAFESAFTRIEGTMADNPIEAVANMVSTIRILAAMVAILTMTIAIWLALLSARILKAERFPPPGMAVIRDVRIIRGAPARIRAWIGFVVAGLCGVGSIVLPLMLLRLVRLITAVQPGSGG